MSYLGLDLGTSGLRALLVDDKGAPIASAERHYTVSNPAPGWSEQDPSDWIAALHGAIDELRAHNPAFGALRGIGVAGHMHGATVLDKADAVLRPCILWNDTRAATQAQLLDQTPGVRDISGNIVFPGFTAPKILWMRDAEPELFSRISKVLLPAAYLNLYLTGEHVADMSDSAGTAWLDVGARQWSDRLLEASGLGIEHMPRLVEGAQTGGQLRDALRTQWGIKGTVSVAGGAGDNAAAACGIGALRDGQGFVSLGTSGVVLAARDGYAPDPATAVHTFCHAVEQRWYQMGVMLSATDSLNWLGRITGQTPAALSGALGARAQSPGAVRFLPYLSGERTPHNDAAIRGAFTGLATASDTADLTRAVLEGVAYGLADSFSALSDTGARFDDVMIIGGGARSPYWCELIATLIDKPLSLPGDGEFGAALGAARLGMCAATGASEDEIMTTPLIAALVEPRADLRNALQDGHARYRSAYQAIKAAQ